MLDPRDIVGLQRNVESGVDHWANFKWKEQK
jgi:hypothetical protein